MADQEVPALTKISEILSEFSIADRKRMLWWLTERFKSEQQKPKPSEQFALMGS